MNKKLVAEFLGTFTLILVGAGSMMTGKLDLLGVALAHGLAIALMVAALGGISGGHFNPAVTFGFFVTKRISSLKAVKYVVSQLMGALAAALVLKGFYGSQSGSLGRVEVMGVSATKAMFAEAVGTFLLTLVVFGVAVDKRGKFGAGFPIGLTISLMILVFGPITGAAINPARWFGPALVSGVWTNSWVWILGPLIGAGLAATLYENIFLEK